MHRNESQAINHDNDHATTMHEDRSGQANLFDIQCSERNIVKSYIIPRTQRKHRRNALEQTFGHDPKHAFTNDSQNKSTHDSRDTLTNDSKHMFGNESKIMLRKTPE